MKVAFEVQEWVREQFEVGRYFEACLSYLSWRYKVIWVGIWNVLIAFKVLYDSVSLYAVHKQYQVGFF